MKKVQEKALIFNKTAKNFKHQWKYDINKIPTIPTARFDLLFLHNPLSAIRQAIP